MYKHKTVTKQINFSIKAQKLHLISNFGTYTIEYKKIIIRKENPQLMSRIY